MTCVMRSTTECKVLLMNYIKKSQNGEVFENLMDLILSRITFYLRIETSKRTKAATRQEQTKRTSQILGVKLLMMW